jgi:CRISPR system Cascade subunit CasE
MYLSQLILNPRSRRVQSEVSNPYELHRTVMQAFPDKNNGGPGRVLFRLELSPYPESNGLNLLVQSEKEPDWYRLGATNGYFLNIPNNNPATKFFDPVFAPGQRLAFRLRANPTIKCKFEGAKNSKRVGLYKEDEQLAWLKRKAEQSGFKVLAVNIMPEGKDQAFGTIRHPNQTSRRMEFLAVRFEGVLQVTDRDKFLAALQNGIGSGKGLGFGLLSLAPA